jgi:type IV pilus assembly protein PilQ
MIPMLALRAAMIAALAAVQGLSVVPAGDRTEVVIDVAGQVTVEHFLLPDPPRIVVDITGTDYGLTQQRFADINRGGVVALRASQYQPNVVRVVVDLASSVDFQVDQQAGEVRISFPNAAGPFQPWSTGERVASGAAGQQAQPPAAQEAPDAVQQPMPQAAAADRPGTPVPVATAQTQSQAHEPPITVTFRNTPILDVLATFADFSGRSIVPGKNIGEGSVNAAIKDQPWDVALNAILQGQGLTAQETETGIIRVDQASALRQAEQAEPLVTRPFRIEYTPVDSIKPAIEGLLTPDVGRVTVNKSTNTLLVTDRESVVKNIAATIPLLDARTPQVTIQAKIVYLNRTAFEGLGIRYEVKDVPDATTGDYGNMFNTLVPGPDPVNPGQLTNQPTVVLGGQSLAAVANASTAGVISPASFEMLGSLVLNRYNIFAWLQAVEQYKLSDTQAAPVLRVLDNREATVQVGARTPIRVIDAQSAGGGTQGVIPRANVQIEQTGVILKVTPHVTGNQVLLQLHAEKSQPEASGTDVGVQFSTQQTDTQVLVNDGETVVIAGLTEVSKDQDRFGIPILMDIPLIGRLFQKTTTTENKTDLLILVTPHIIRDGGS